MVRQIWRQKNASPPFWWHCTFALQQAVLWFLGFCLPFPLLIYSNSGQCYLASFSPWQIPLVSDSAEPQISRSPWICWLWKNKSYLICLSSSKVNSFIVTNSGIFLVILYLQHFLTLVTHFVITGIQRFSGKVFSLCASGKTLMHFEI